MPTSHNDLPGVLKCETKEFQLLFHGRSFIHSTEFNTMNVFRERKSPFVLLFESGPQRHTKETEFLEINQVMQPRESYDCSPPSVAQVILIID